MARILVIDDEHNIRMMVRIALQHDGHTVGLAPDGNEGLEKFGNGENWDLTLLDQRMPGLEGLAVLKQIRYHQPDARVIMATAFGTIDLAVEAMKAGAKDFLRKPFTADMLRDAVEVALKDTPAQTTRTPSRGVTFGTTTINGYRIEFEPDTETSTSLEKKFQFTIRRPDGEARECNVVLSPVVVELIKAHIDRDTLPGGNRYWQALSEEALANYLYQNADFPPDNLLQIEELTSGLRRFMETILPPQ